MTATSTTLNWRKASASQQNGNCVEVAETATDVAMRNSRDPLGARLLFTRAEFTAFVQGAKAGEFDELTSN